MAMKMEIIPAPNPKKVRTAKLHVYMDMAGEWRWTLKSTNGRVIADSGEGYKKRAAAVAAATKVKEAASTAEISVLPIHGG